MNRTYYLMVKELRQIAVNTAVIFLAGALPIIQIAVLPLAANYEVKNVPMLVIDHDRSADSRLLLRQICAGGIFSVQQYASDAREARAKLDRQIALVIIEIPDNFGREFRSGNTPPLGVQIDAINGGRAAQINSYLNDIVAQFYNTAGTLSRQIINDRAIRVLELRRFNPYGNYPRYMVPGILPFLVTMLGVFLTALNIVREREDGTIEQLNVTPITPLELIIGKMLPIWMLGMIVFTLGLVVGWLAYGIIPAGSLYLLYFYLAVYQFAVLGGGLLLSNFCKQQSTAVLIGFCAMLIGILMCGLLFSVDSMPLWAQKLSAINPITYFVKVDRMILLKGSGMKYIWKNLLTMGALSLVINYLAIVTYKKTRR